MRRDDMKIVRSQTVAVAFRKIGDREIDEFHVLSCKIDLAREDLSAHTARHLVTRNDKPQLSTLARTKTDSKTKSTAKNNRHAICMRNFRCKRMRLIM